MARASRSGPSREERRASAKAALERFWGGSNGGNEAWGELLTALNDLGLDEQDRAFLALNLPIPETTGGTTAARIARARQCLELMGVA